MRWSSVGVFLAACGASAPTASPQVEVWRPHILFISLDTTRADALGTYSAESHWGLDLAPGDRPQPVTPVLDRIAASGVRFAWALSSAPTTLSSHTTAFSGMDSHGHRVVRNGFPVPADVPLLPEALAAAGWDTRGVVGSTVLDASMGFSRGFRTFAAPDASAEAGAHDYTWSANTVTSRALASVDAHLTENADQPLFLFVHFYDPHMPWNDAPAEIREAMGVPGYAGPVDGSMASIQHIGAAVRQGNLDPLDRRQARALYLAEVAGVDTQIGRLMAGLESRGLLEDVLIVVMGDHGETLDDNAREPYAHGAEVELVDIHVPMLLATLGSEVVPAGLVVSQPVGVMDIPATLGGLLGPRGHASLQALGGAGIDLQQMWRMPAPSVPIRFAEATRPIGLEAKERWNNLPFQRSAIGPGPLAPLQLKVIPLAGDARALHTLAPGAPLVQAPSAPVRAAAKDLLDALTVWDQSAPPHRDVTFDDRTRDALIELGYLDPESD